MSTLSIEIGTCELTAENGAISRLNYILIPYELTLAFRDFMLNEALESPCTWLNMVDHSQMVLFPSGSLLEVRRLRRQFQASCSPRSMAVHTA